MSDLVTFEPAKNGKKSVIVGGISFLCDSEEEGRRKAATMLLREVVRLRSAQDNPLEQLASVRRQLDALDQIDALRAELDLLRNRKDYHAEYMEVMAEVVQVRQSRETWRNNFIAIVECLDGANQRAEAAEQSRDRMREALASDASGRPVYQLLRIAADMLSNGAGPVVDCLRLKADELELLGRE